MDYELGTAAADGLVCACAAKFNFFLDCGARRPDGYHPLQSVMQRIDLHDTLRVAGAPQGVCTCEDTRAACACADTDNLVCRAARALIERYAPAAGVAMTLDKRVPVSAGLGGGSADAATALRALRQLWSLPADDAALHAIAQTLGADVPFFLGTAAALCAGVGEQLQPLAAQTYHVVVWNPGVPLLTKDVYRQFDQQPRPHRPVAPFLVAYASGDPAHLAALIWNNLALAAEELMPALRDMQHELEHAGALRAWISGSGPSVIGLCADAADATALADRLRAHVPPQHFIHAGRTLCDD
jgi:4-diphosphocytidyl-2-C-methyl-D-erythritol kinase